MNAPAALAGSVVVVVVVVGGHPLWSFRHSRSRCFRTRRRHRFCASRQCRTGHCTGGHFSVVTSRGQYTRHSGGGGFACVGAPRKSTRPTSAMAYFMGRPQGARCWVARSHIRPKRKAVAVLTSPEALLHCTASPKAQVCRRSTRIGPLPEARDLAHQAALRARQGPEGASARAALPHFGAPGGFRTLGGRRGAG